MGKSAVLSCMHHVGDAVIVWSWQPLAIEEKAPQLNVLLQLNSPAIRISRSVGIGMSAVPVAVAVAAVVVAVGMEEVASPFSAWIDSHEELDPLGHIPGEERACRVVWYYPLRVR